jgi:putative FmdB family regulatory protein
MDKKAPREPADQTPACAEQAANLSTLELGVKGDFAELERRQPKRYNFAMPLYEFHCDACDKDSEVLVRSTDWKGTKCPKCGSPRLQKKLSVFASSVAGESAPQCSGVPSSCGRCGTGVPHSH